MIASNPDELKNDAYQMADDLLHDAANSVSVMLEYIDNQPSAAVAILTVGHALIAQRDRHQVELLEAVSDIAECLDCIAARPDADDGLTDRERQLIYRALEADWICQNEAPSIADMDKALARFKRLAGL